MSGSGNRVWWIALALLALVLLLLLGGRVQRELLPEPRRAHVAISTDAGAARVGRVELAAGAPFRLHAVLEADSVDGEPVYYTEAEGLVLEGRPVPQQRLRPPRRFADARVLWFSVEGPAPYLEVAEGEALTDLDYREVFRADWARAWSVPGSITSSHLEATGGRDDLPIPPFGTLRFHLRIELFGPESEITPRHRLRSPGADALPAARENFATATVGHADIAHSVARVFGLPQVELPVGASAADKLLLLEWTERDLAFSRVTLLRRLFDEAGVAWEDAGWAEVELDGSQEWLRAGDLLRVGERFVVLYQDRGTPGRLDYDDLCLDFDRGAAVRRLGEIFTGQGLVEWARLPSADSE